MARVITFSRFFPSYHPRKGEPTFFTEKLNRSLDVIEYGIIFRELIHNDIPFFDCDYYETCEPKFHTIRAGNRWKVGDKFSPRVWRGKPYCSKQIVIAPDIEIKKIWRFEIKERELLIDGNIKGSTTNLNISLNDGLHYKDFLAWFKYPKPFSGQIICWNDKIEY